MKATTLLVGALVALPTLAMLSTAATQPYCQQSFESFHCFSQYEASSDALALRVSCDQLPKTLCPADGHFDAGGVIYDGGRSPNHHNNGGDPDRDLPAFPGVFFDEKVYVNDAVFGQNVGVFYCQDVNGNGLCGEGNGSQPDGRGEPAFIFCGHTDLGAIDTNSFFWAGYYVVGPVFQGRDCANGASITLAGTGTTISTSTNPIGGTTGTMSIWLTQVPPQPPRDDGHASIDYGVWGGGSAGDGGAQQIGP